MFRHQLWIWSLLLFLPVGQVFAQSSLKNKADKLFCEWAYKAAAAEYETLIATYDSVRIDPDVYYKIASCYMAMDQPEAAVPWYAESIKHEKNSPTDYYDYARALQNIERYVDASAWFAKYDDTIGAANSIRGLRAAQNLQDIEANPLQVEVKNAVSLNTRRSEMGASFYGDGIVFSSDRYEGSYGSKTFNWTGNAFYNIYYARQDGQYNFNTPQLFIATIASPYHDGPTTFADAGKQMIFTRNHSKAAADEDTDCKNRSIVNLKLMQTVDDPKNGWTRASEDPFINLNSPEHTISHPALSADGKVLYFTSDNDAFPGHQGGTDIYKATLEEGIWVNPTNLGKAINSEEDEGFPFIYQDSILFFASNGNIGNGGLGGLDLYKSTYDAAANTFSAAINLGTPINSSRDDFGLIIKEKKPGEYYGYFTSSRTAQQDPLKVGGDDIYYFYPAQSLNILVQARHSVTQEPITGASVAVRQLRDTLTNGTTNSQGQFFDAGVIDLGSTYTVGVQIQGVTLEKSFSTTGYSYGDTVIVNIEHCPIEVSGIATNYLTGEPLADVELDVVDQQSQQKFTVTTNDMGAYVFSALPNTTYNVTASKFGYRLLSQQVSTAGKDCEIISLSFAMLTSDRFLTNVYYYFDKADIYLYEESINDLEDLTDFLKDNPGLRVELRAHTDSRGSFSYNEQLAQRRAQSVKDYLIDQGIDEDRLTPIAFGEYCLTNECTDDVSCNEIQHQRNRRTEIVVTNLDGEIVARGRELERWMQDEEFFVEGGRYEEMGKGSNWYVKEIYSGKHGSWRKVAVRKTCD